MTTATASQELKEVAFYYPGPMWQRSGWVKNLLLFFDEIALLVPSYMKNRPEVLEPEMAIPLSDQGLLRILEPETIVDKQATVQLTTALTDIITSGVLDPLTKSATAFEELSWSRLGGYGDAGLAEMIFDELKARNLARDSEDGVSIPMHPMVRSLVLALLAQILRAHGKDAGLNLSPATDRWQLVGALRDILGLASGPSAGHVVNMDLETVGVDLADVPLDEVLSFRKTYSAEHRQYAVDVRRFVRDISLLSHAERDREMQARMEQIKEAANGLSGLSRKNWKGRAAFTMSIAGAAWTIASGNPIGAAFAVGGAILGYKSMTKDVGAYSYLFKVQHAV
jgi:hypothetical protein